MPEMHVSLQKVNAAFAASNIAKLDTLTLLRSTSLLALLDALPNCELSAAAKAFVKTWPSALQAAVLAAIRDNLSRPADQRVPIVLSWTPGYDFDVRIWDIRNTTSTHGELTIHVTSRYPGDPHPMGAPS